MGILREQRALGWTTLQLTSPKHYAPSPPVETIDGIDFHRTPAPRRGLRNSRALDQLATIRAMEVRLRELVARYQPDIIHAHSPALNAWAALRVGRSSGIPVVYEVRGFWEDAAVEHGTARKAGPRYWLSRRFETLALQRVDAVTTISEGLRGDIVKRGISASKVTLIPNAVDPARFSVREGAHAPAPAWKDGPGKPVLGFIGSFYSYEGLDLLLEALPAIIAYEPQVRLLLVGGGPEEDRLRQIADELDLGNHVVFAGRISEDQVPGWYRLIDLLVYPRKSGRLTELVTPLKPLEAMAAKRIVAASNVGGHRELIGDDRTGYLFPSGDPNALAERLLEILRRRGDWPRITAEARGFIDSERNWQAVVRRYRDVYGELLPPGRLAAATEPMKSGFMQDLLE